MRRPPSKYPEYRLDTLLKRKADQGVKIYIVVYKVSEKSLVYEERKNILVFFFTATRKLPWRN